MNPDVTYASCDAPQEKTDKEVELDEDGNEVRKGEEERIVFSLLRFDVNECVFSLRRFSLANEFDCCFEYCGEVATIEYDALMRKKEQKQKK